MRFCGIVVLVIAACSQSPRGAPDAGSPSDGGDGAGDAASDAPPATRYEVVRGWPALEPGAATGQVSGVAAIAGEVLVFHRADRPWLGEAAGPPIARPTLFQLGADRGEIRARAGADRFSIPHGLRRAPNGSLWVTDVGTHRVHELSPAGEVRRTFGTGVAGNDTKSFDGPTDVYVAPDGAIFVADGYGNHRVVKLSAAGEYLLEWGGAGSGPGQLETPHSICGDERGRIYVADRGNARVQRFDAGGRFLDAWQSREIGRPWAVTVGKDGFVYVVDGGDQPAAPPDRAGVVKLDQDGHVLARWSEHGLGEGQLEWPHAVAVGDDGAVYVGEVRGGSRVQKFVPAR